MQKSIIVVGCLLIALSVTSCGKKAEEKVAENLVGKILSNTIGQNASVDIDGENVSIKTGKGSIDVTDGNVNIKSEYGNVNVVSGEDAKNVAFPEDVYKYPGAEVTVASVAPTGLHFGLKTTDETKQVYNSYKTEMEKMGWTTKMSAQEDGEGMLMLEKGEKMTQIIIGNDDEMVSISLMVSENK